MRNIGTVIRFTLRTKMMTKSFLITTVIIAALMTIGMNLPYLFSLFSSGSSGEEATKLGLVTGSYPAIEQSLEQSLNEQNNLQLIPYADVSEDQMKIEVEEGKIEGYLKLVQPESGTAESFPQILYTGEDSLGMSDEMLLTNTLTVLKTQWIVQDSLSDVQKQQLNEPISFVTVTFDEMSNEAKTSEEMAQEAAATGVDYMVVLVLIVLLFMTNTMTGNMIASEVTQEKSSRIMEILITSVSPMAQMFGKIIGMFVLGLMQIFMLFLVVVINMMLPHNATAWKDMNIDLTMVDPGLVGLGLLLFVLGYFLYATLFAAIGSIVSRTEDLGQAIMPITMISLVAFYIPFFSISTPDSLIMKISSYVPFFTPTTMLLRIGIGEVAWWEILISILILLVSILVCGWLSAKIYRTGVLMYGKLPTIKEIGKAMRAYKI